MTTHDRQNSVGGRRQEETIGKIVPVAIAFVLVTSTFILAQQRAAAQGSAPRWTAGDYWRYSGQDIVGGQSLSYAFTLDVIGKESVQVVGHSNETYHCHFSGTAAYGGVSMDFAGDTYLSTSDLAIVKTQMTAPSPGNGNVYDPPLEEFHFPLYDGQWWSQYVQEVNWGMGYFWRFNVSGPETISVAAGSFSAFRIEGNTPGTTSRDYYSDTVGFLVRTTGLFISTQIPIDLDLQSYNYQKDGSTLLLLVLFVIIIAAVCVTLAAYLIARRQRRALTQPMIPPQAPYMGQPPLQPPSQPPSPPKW